MIDIETLSSRQNAIVLQVSGVFFDETGLGLFFDFFPSVSEQEKLQRHCSPETMFWWAETIKELGYAPRCMREPEEHREGLKEVFLLIESVFKDEKPDFFWQCGQFDFPIISNLASQLGIDFSLVIPYWKQMDFRTLKNLPANRERYEQLRKLHPKKHGAIEDAKAQSEIAIELMYRQ